MYNTITDSTEDDEKETEVDDEETVVVKDPGRFRTPALFEGVDHYEKDEYEGFYLDRTDRRDRNYRYPADDPGAVDLRVCELR